MQANYIGPLAAGSIPAGIVHKRYNLSKNLPRKRFSKFESTSDGIVNSPFPIHSKSLYILSASNGYKPVVILYLQKYKTKDICKMHHRHQNHTDVFVNGNFERSYTCMHIFRPGAVAKNATTCRPSHGWKNVLFPSRVGRLKKSSHDYCRGNYHDIR